MIGSSPIGRAEGGMAKKLAIIAGFASLAFAGLAIAMVLTPGGRIQVRLGSPTEQTASTGGSGGAAAQPQQQNWVAAAPGRVEPKSGQIRLGASQPGKVEALAVAISDKVAEGEVLVRLRSEERRVGREGRWRRWQW